MKDEDDEDEGLWPYEGPTMIFTSAILEIRLAKTNYKASRV